MTGTDLQNIEAVLTMQQQEEMRLNPQNIEEAAMAFQRIKQLEMTKNTLKNYAEGRLDETVKHLLKGDK